MDIRMRKLNRLVAPRVVAAVFCTLWNGWCARARFGRLGSVCLDVVVCHRIVLNITRDVLCTAAFWLGCVWSIARTWLWFNFSSSARSPTMMTSHCARCRSLPCMRHSTCSATACPRVRQHIAMLSNNIQKVVQRRTSSARCLAGLYRLPGKGKG